LEDVFRFAQNNREHDLSEWRESAEIREKGGVGNSDVTSIGASWVSPIASPSLLYNPYFLWSLKFYSTKTELFILRVLRCPFTKIWNIKTHFC